MFPAFLTTIFFSLSAVSGNRCARAFGGLEANFYRLVIACTLLGIYAAFFGQRVSGSPAAVFALSGMIGVGLGDMLFFQALPRLNSRLTILLIQCLSVPIAAAVEWIWLGTILSVPQCVAIVFILGGIALAIAPSGDFKPQPGHILSGVIFAVLAAIGNGLGAVLSRKAYALAAAAGQEIDGTTAAYNRVLGGLVVAGIVICIARWSVISRCFASERLAISPAYKEKWRRMWPWVISTSLAGQTLGVTCFQWALKTHPTGVILPVVAMTPLVAIPFAYYLERERPSWRSLLGGVIAVAGVIALLKLAR